ncbi:unnamed protein product [Camellia sinensis]
MKRKRSGGKRKPKMTPMVGAKEGFLNTVTLNTQDVSFLDDYDNAELYSRMETEAPQNGSNESSMNSFPEKNVVVSADLSKNARSKMTKPSRGLAASSIKPSSNTRMETEASQNGNNESRQHTANLLKNARRKMTKLSGGLAASSIKPSKDTEVVQGGRSHQKDPKLPKSSRGSASSSIKANSKTELVQGGRRTHQKDPKSTLQDPLYKEQELKAALAVIRKVMKMDAAQPFNLPVDPIALGIPDYFDVIDTPMDFGTICKNLENGVRYKNSKDVFGDVQYIWDNCSKYNGEGHHISGLMKRVKKNLTKYWTEAGLYKEQPQEINGYSDVAPMESTMRCSTHEHSSLVGPIIDYPRHQQQHQMDLSQHQPYHPSRSYIMSYQQQQMPCQHQCQCQLRSGEQQTSHLQAGRNVGSAVCRGHFCSLPPVEPMIRSCNHGPRFPVGPMTDYARYEQQDLTSPSQMCPQPSASYGQPRHLQQETCRVQLNSSQAQPSQPQIVLEMGSAGHLCSPPPVESMIRCSKRGPPRCPVGPMTNYTSHEQQEQIGPSQMQFHHPSVSNGQQHQPQQGLSPSQPQTGLDMGSASMLCPGLRVKQDVLQDLDLLICWPRGLFCVGEMPYMKKGYTLLLDSLMIQLCSPPPVESMIRCRKHGPPRCPVGAMTDYTSHEQQEQIGPSQMQFHHPSVSKSQPQQHQQGLSPSQPQTGLDMGRASMLCPGSDSSSIRRTRGRGPTRCLDVWNMEGKISISVNELGQPIGLEAPKLTNFLGTIARNGHMAPLNYVDWRALPDEIKEKMWQQVQSKFEIDPKSKSWVLKSIGKKWKDWKAELKANHYNTHKTDEERLADRDERVVPDQWQILISFWNSKEAKERSVTNKASRAQQKITHTTGRKSFAQIREEQRAKRPDKEPSRAELFILTRTRKDGQPVNKESSVLISQLRERAAQQKETSQNGTVKDDILSQVMGQDRHGRVRTYGLGPAPSAVKMVSKANVEVHDMKEKMASMEQTCAQMASQMSSMMSMMLNMQKKFPSEQGSPSELLHAGQVADVSNNSRESPQLQAIPPSHVQGVPSHQGRAVKRGKTQNAKRAVKRGKTQNASISKTFRAKRIDARLIPHLICERDIC